MKTRGRKLGQNIFNAWCVYGRSLIGFMFRSVCQQTQCAVAGSCPQPTSVCSLTETNTNTICPEPLAAGVGVGVGAGVGVGVGVVGGAASFGPGNVDYCTAIDCLFTRHVCLCSVPRSNNPLML